MKRDIIVSAYQSFNPLKSLYSNFSFRLFNDYEDYLTIESNNWEETLLPLLSVEKKKNSLTKSIDKKKSELGKKGKNILNLFTNPFHWLSEDETTSYRSTDKIKIGELQQKLEELIVHRRESIDLFCHDFNQKALSRNTSLEEIVSGLHETITRSKYDDAREAREKFLAMMMLRSNDGLNNRIERNKAYKPFYQSVLTIEELHSHIFEHKTKDLITYLRSKGVELSDEDISKKRFKSLEVVEKSIMISSLLYNFAVEYALTLHGVKVDDTLNPNERESLQDLITKTSLNVLDSMFLGIKRHEEKGISSINSENSYIPNYLLVKDILSNYMVQQHPIGGLTQLSTIYSSYTLSTKKKYDYFDLTKIFSDQQIGGKYKRGELNPLYVKSLSNKIGLFPLGIGVYFRGGINNDRCERGIVIKFKLKNKTNVSGVTRNAQFISNPYRIELSNSENLFFNPVRKAMTRDYQDINLTFIEEAPIWNPGEMFERRTGIFTEETLYKKKIDLR